MADTYELIRGFLRQVVRAAGGRLSSLGIEASEPFCDPKPDIDWQDPQARKAHLGELAATARTVLAEVGTIEDPAVADPASLLAQVVDSDTEDDGEGRLQIRQGVARDRIVSHSDPEMRHGRKSASRRFDGGLAFPPIPPCTTFVATNNTRQPARIPLFTVGSNEPNSSEQENGLSGRWPMDLYGTGR
ncbi:MAG: hypothetical protein ACRDHM_09395, partial [Actinomycetota bacterium]